MMSYIEPTAIHSATYRFAHALILPFVYIEFHNGECTLEVFKPPHIALPYTFQINLCSAKYMQYRFFTLLRPCEISFEEDLLKQGWWQLDFKNKRRFNFYRDFNLKYLKVPFRNRGIIQPCKFSRTIHCHICILKRLRNTQQNKLFCSNLCDIDAIKRSCFLWYF